MFIIFSVFYILVAAAMIVLILIQRGEGADAGSGFGGGASGTVFGARGSASFLSRATGTLAGVFFVLSLGMGMYLAHTGARHHPANDLGVMAGMQTPAATTPATSSAKPAANPTTDVPSAAVPGTVAGKPAAPTTGNSDVPAAPKAPATDTSSGHKQGSRKPSKN